MLEHLPNWIVNPNPWLMLVLGWAGGTITTHVYAKRSERHTEQYLSNEAAAAIVQFNEITKCDA